MEKMKRVRRMGDYFPEDFPSKWEYEEWDPPNLECERCGWKGNYDDLILPPSGCEPSCPECLNDDFVEVE